MANLQVGVAGNGTVTVGAGASVHSPASNTLTLGSNNAERVRIDSSGRLLANHNASVGSGKIQAFASQDAVDILSYSTTNTHGGRLTFYRSKNATIGSNTEVADGDSLGRIDWRGYNDDGTTYNQGARIEALVDGAVNSSTDMPTSLVFKTSPDGSSTPSERLRIDSSGRLGIGDDNPTVAVSIKHTAPKIKFIDSDATGTPETLVDGSGGDLILDVDKDNEKGSTLFAVKLDSSEKLRITSDGSMGLGTTPETDGQANSLYFANGNANIWGSGNVNLYTVVNARYTGSAWKYNNTAVASYVGQQSGVWSFHNAASGTADAAATFTERIRIGTSGEIGIAGANYGSSGQVLTSGGSGSAVSWATAGGITQADFWRLSSSLQANQLPIASNLERVDTYGFGTGSLLGSGMTESSGIFTFPATGLYWVHAFGNVYSANHSQTNTLQIRYTADGGSNWATASVGAQGIYDQGSDSYGNIGTNALIDVTSTSNVKVAFNFGAGQGGEYLEGHTTYTYTGFIFIRLAAT